MSEPSLLWFLLVVSFFAIVLVPLYQYVRRRRRDLFEPVYLGTLVFFMMFWVRSVYILVWGSDVVGDAPFPRDILRAWNICWLYLLLAVALFYRSYYSRLGASIARAFALLPGQWSLGRAHAAIGILFAVGLSALVIQIRQIGSLTAYIFQKGEVLSTLGTGPLVLLELSMALSMQMAYAVWLTRRSSRTRFILILVALLAVVGQGMQGTKGSFIFMFLSLLILRHYLLRPVRPRAVFLFVLSGVFLVFPAFNALRHATDPESFQRGWGGNFESGQVMAMTAERFSGIDALIFIVRDTPRVMDYQYGKTYANVLVSWIPREVWPGKPLLGFGQVFTPIYLGHIFTPGGTTYAPTIFGEAYVNFDVVGIILAAAGGGIFLRALYEYLILRNRNVSGVLAYAVTLPYVLIGLEAHSAAWLTTGWLFLVARVLSFFVAERKSRLQRWPAEA